MALTALALNCTLKSGKEKSSTDKILGEVMDAFEKLGVTGEILRVADYNVKPGVKNDEGKGDDWPHILKKLLAADILILGTPIWMGQPGSIAKRVCERLDAFFDDTDPHAILREGRGRGRRRQLRRRPSRFRGAFPSIKRCRFQPRAKRRDLLGR